MFSIGSKRLVDKHVTVVIRGVGERTEQTCRALLAHQIRQKNIHLINETPFSNALRKSYEIGIKSGRKWTLVVDADVLASDNIIHKLFECAESRPKTMSCVQSSILDKFFGGVRVGGMKLYRTDQLEQACTLIPQVNIRPEATVIKTMHKTGHYVDITDIVCGLHDFEQSYADIFRKGFAHGIKHASLTKLIMPYWERQSNIDKDFCVLIAGYRVGSMHKESLKLSKDEVREEFDRYIKSAKLDEKSPTLAGYDSPAEITKKVSAFMSPPEYDDVMREITKMGRPEVPKDAQ